LTRGARVERGTFATVAVASFCACASIHAGVT